jgi:hypothetical protein
MTHIEDANTMIRLRDYLKELGDTAKSGGLWLFYRDMQTMVDKELKARGIKRTTVMRVKT